MRPVIVALVCFACLGPLVGSVGMDSCRKHRIDAANADLNDPERASRIAAVRTLEKLGRHGFEHLVKALSHKDEAVREAVVGALGRATTARPDKALVDALHDPSSVVRRATIAALFRFGKDGVPHLYDALKTGEADVRKEIAYSLGDERDRSAEGPLTAALKDADPEVRSVAEAALAKIRATASIASRTGYCCCRWLGFSPPTSCDDYRCGPVLATPHPCDPYR